MTGEGGADVMTKPVDFKIAPEVSEQRNFTPLPEFQKSTMTEPPKYEKPTTTPQIDQIMADILAQGKDNNPQTAVKQVEKNLPQETKNPQGFWLQLKEAIENFFRNLFR